MLIQRFSNLEFPHWESLKDGIVHLIQNGTYQELVDIHAARGQREPVLPTVF